MTSSTDFGGGHSPRELNLRSGTFVDDALGDLGTTPHTAAWTRALGLGLLLLACWPLLAHFARMRRL
jgi:hypothetical protein